MTSPNVLRRLLALVAGVTVSAVLPGVARAEPVSRAGATFLAYPGDTIVLDGSASEGDDLDWRWVQTGGPRVAATDTDTAHPRFRADLPGRYTFELVVWEGQEAGRPDSVDVVVVDPEVATRYAKESGCSQQGGGALAWVWLLPAAVAVGRKRT